MTSSAALRLPTSRKGWSALLADLGMRPSKGMGQNFLVERGIVERIVRTAGVEPGDYVVEIGPGLGILTSQLLDAGALVTGIELDRRLVPHLRDAFGAFPGFSVVEADALTVDFGELLPSAQPYAVVANLPYSVGNAVIMHAMEGSRQPQKMTVMVQREVAERLVAEPPEMTVLGVAAQTLARARIAFHVGPQNFLPPPKVESSVIILEPRGDELLPAEARRAYFRIVNAGFRHKRKTIANSLSMELALPKETASHWLESAGIDPSRRAETLAVTEWLRLHADSLGTA